ncbi:MAG TPA: transcription elongation factor GreA, partial [Gemmataceae bacterium]
MSGDRIPMSRDGYENKKAELEQANREMLEVTKRVAAARDMGDLSENAEYHAAREDQGMLQARINLLKDQLARAYIVERSDVPDGVVVFGARVLVRDLDLDEEEEFVLVGPGDDDPLNNRILTTSPIGQGLMGKRCGEIAEIQA